ncbi:MAG TPA: hypothetical protein VLK78_08035 [Candidatus Angelobacter sp.]|nr:hypothetical protein [Candidatus Angelobacter sp.]
MYVGRDLMALTMVSKSEWRDTELAYFNHCFQQVTPFLNSQGVTLRNEITEEIETRGGFFHRNEADWTNGTRISYD